jgi:ribosome maturation factor RimP
MVSESGVSPLFCFRKIESMNAMMDELIHQAIGESIADLSAATGDELYVVEAAIRAGGRKIELTVDTDKGSASICARS